MGKKHLNLWIGTISLLLGGIIYVIFRPNTYIGKLFSFRFISKIQLMFSNLPSCFISCYFADFLWDLSLCSFLVSIFNPKIKGIICCGLFSFIIGTIWEILQYFQIVNGTADILDITCYLVASIISVILNIIFTIREYKDEKKF